MNGLVRRLDWLTDRNGVVGLLLALFILSLLGVGNVMAVSLLGLLLCAAGLTQRPARVDWWTFVPLVAYNLASMASSWRALGNITGGYGGTQMLYPVLYLLAACLTEEEGALFKKLCAVWAGGAAAAGIVQLAGRAAAGGGTQRLAGVFGSPNAMGSFLVVSWFLLLGLREEEESRLWGWLEPVLLAALALTLSMGSLLSMAAGLGVLAAARKASWREWLAYVWTLLARAALGIGTGMLVYLAAARTDMPWLGCVAALYILAEMACWEKFLGFLDRRPRMALLLAAMGALVALAAIVVRPSAADTFRERLEMMANGAGYLGVSPLLGLGPYRWRLRNLQEGPKYFNTWHIHNVPLHIAVELGWIAFGALAAAVLRFYQKRKAAQPAERAGVTAFLFHNLIDTSFFYMGATALVLLWAGRPQQGGRAVGAGVQRVLFGMFGLLFAWHLYYALTAG